MIFAKPLSMLVPIYQFERSVILEREKERVAIVEAQGKGKGRPKSISSAPIFELLDGRLSLPKTTNRLGMSFSTVQRVKIETRAVIGAKDR